LLKCFGCKTSEVDPAKNVSRTNHFGGWKTRAEKTERGRLTIGGKTKIVCCYSDIALGLIGLFHALI